MITTFFSRLRAAFVAACRRFPMVVGFLVLSFVTITFCNHRSDSIPYSWTAFLFIYPLLAAWLSVVLHLWFEETTLSLGRKAISASIAHLLWLFMALAHTVPDADSAVEGTALLAVVLLLAVLSFTVSFLRELDDLPFWHFAMRSIGAVGIALGVGIVMTFGLHAFLYGLSELFSLHIYDVLDVDVTSFCFVILAPMTLLQFIPACAEKHNRTAEGLSRRLSGVVHYLFLPLLGLYMAVLYVYGMKILVTWTLPQGTVTWLVTAMMGGLLTILVLLYPARFQPDKRFDNLLSRWLPVAAVPLLVLMTIAIGRRIADYGFTFQRLYVLTFNLWCYAACHYLFWCRRRKLSHVLLSLALLGIVTSVGPQSYARVMLRVFKSKLITLAETHDAPQLPMSSRKLEQWVSLLDSVSRKDVIAATDYLTSNYRPWQYSSIFTERVFLSSLAGNEKPAVPFLSEPQSAYSLTPVKPLMDISKYRLMEQLSDSVFDVEPSTDSTLTIYYGPCRPLQIPIDELAARSLYENQSQIVLDNAEITLIINSFNYNPKRQTISLGGLKLTK